MNQKLRQRLIQLGLIAVIIIALVGVYFLFPTFRPQIGPAPTPTPFPTPTPIPIAPGPQTYAISSRGGSTTITEATFNPLDASVGENQIISVKAVDAAGIASMSATFMGDEGQKVSLPLKLTTGTNKDGVWMATWIVTLPHTKLYSAAITAYSGRSPVTIDLWFR